MEAVMGIRTKASTWVAALALALVAAVAWADPPARAIRIASVTGAVSFLPSGEGEWVQARVNRPLWTGDRLWIDRAARSELQLGGATLFVAPESSVAVLNFDDDRAQFEVTQGTVVLYVRKLGRDDVFEIDTPNLAFVVRSPGEYRIEVQPDGDATAVAVMRGEGDAFGTRAAYTLRAGQGFRFFGTDLAEYDAEPVRRTGAWESWVAARVRSYERSASARYVSQQMVGYADLDAYGTWRTVANYGPVWVPSRVDADWTPYRYGHWSWVEPWGWTWIDDAPWGFAPFHYGRWAHVDNRYWAWVPGPREAAPVYAPALVAFVGGAGFSATVSSGPAVAWFPLAPGEVYRPAYDASRDYFTRVNVTNTVVNVTNVVNVYDNPRTNVRYVNVGNVNAVTAVPAQAFVQSKPVQRAAVRMDRNALRAAQVVAAAPIAPAVASVTGAAPPARARPNDRVLNRKVVAREAPPPAPASIERRQEALQRQPGKPLDRAEIGKSGPARQNVTVVQSATAPTPIPAATPGERGKGRDRDGQAAKGQRPPEPPVAQPSPGERGKGNANRGRDEPAQPAAKAPQPANAGAAAPPPPPPATASAQVAQPEPRGRCKRVGDQARPQPPAQPAARAAEPSRSTVAPPAPQPAPPPQAAQPAPAQRGKGHADKGRPESAEHPAAKAPQSPHSTAAAPQAAPPVPPQAAQPVPPTGAERGRGNAQRAAPPPPQPAPAAPAAGADRGRGNAQRAEREAAPAPPPPQANGKGNRGRDDDGGPPGQRGKGRD
jgi:hypothetical protein